MASKNTNENSAKSRASRRMPAQESRNALADEKRAQPTTPTGSTADKLQGIVDDVAAHDARLHEIAQTVSANITNPQYYFGLAQELVQQQSYERAMRLFQRALEVDPKHVAACLALARGHQRLDQTETAESYLQQAYEIEPQNVETLLLWSAMLVAQNRFESAETKLRQILELQPGHPVALCELANLERQHGRLDSALKMMDQALSSEDCDHNSRFGRGLLALQQGEWSYGWKEYDSQSRSTAPELSERILFPLWDGTSLQGKRLLVQGCRSAIDNLMFASCLQDVSAAADKCVVAIGEGMNSLFERSFDDVKCIHLRQLAKLQDGDFDVWTPLASLPRFLRTTTARFPTETSTLVPNSSWREWYRQSLFDLGPGLKVGISWEGLWPSKRKDARATRLQDWKPVLDVEGVHLLNLQGPDSAEAWDAALELHPRAELVHWDQVEPRGDVDELASVISALDLVIAVPNRVAHLAGALGVPTWNILSDWPSWRWGLSGEKTPWYPQMTLYRATQPNNWLAPMTAMARELQQLARKKSNWVKS